MIEMPVFQIFSLESINLAKMFQNTGPTLTGIPDQRDNALL
jgi:hypothetical protein